ncbi:unnamed protein product [Prunus armeniaca]
MNLEAVYSRKMTPVGGLGIKRSAWMNQALLAKTGWRLLQHEQGVKWRVGSGDNVLFWTDRWLSCGPLYQYALIDLSEEMLQLKLILSVHTGFNGSGADRDIWQFTPNGSFSLLTNVQRQKRGLTQVPTCPKCDYPMETIAHLFKDCPFLLAIWNCLQIGDNSSPNMMDFKEWLLRNLQSKRKIAPTYGVCKINTDGSRNSDSRFIGAGGLLRDNYGAWIKGFSVNLGVGSVLEVELWGIFWGLHLAWEAGFRFVEVESDSSVVVALLSSSTISTHPLFSLGAECGADVLASKSFEFGPGVQYFTEVPAFLLTCLAEDAVGVSRSRVVCA